MEIYIDIIGFEGLYQISNYGNIKSLRNNKILSQQIKSNGYYIVKLNKDKSQFTYYVHRLVAQAFIQKIENKPEINHIDGDKSNNNDWNLEWCTRGENNKHAYNTGLKLMGEKHCNAKLTDNEIYEIRKLKGKLSQYKVAKLYGINQSYVSALQNNTKRCLA